ncbi:MAG: BtrH N-terminal domain-containing protein, partial [Chloroflexi bacterium]|nr:BtrH N-terminal domain-containing protein [Chloroflexota bacterium]
MNLQPFLNFRPVNTHHCVTGSMRHVYLFHDHDISEEMMLGLGQGVGFIYWHQKGAQPFLGGRATPKPSMEELAAHCTGVKMQQYVTTSTKKAKRTLVEMMGQQQPLMLQVDMGFLPYFDFEGEEYHFGGHVVVACGYDPATETVLIAERDGVYPVPMSDLAQARGSTFKPFPPK